MSLQNLFVQDSGKSYQDVYCDKLVANELEVAGGSQSTSLDFSGIWAAPQTRTVVYERIGDVVTLRIPVVTNTATVAAGITSTALPSELHPAAAQEYAVSLVDNATFVLGVLKVETDGTIEVFSGAFGGAFAGAGLSGIQGMSVTYSLQ